MFILFFIDSPFHCSLSQNQCIQSCFLWYSVGFIGLYIISSGLCFFSGFVIFLLYAIYDSCGVPDIYFVGIYIYSYINFPN